MKESAPSNILLIYVTSLDTFHLLSGWLKEVASRNIYHIFVKSKKKVWKNPNVKHVV